MIAQGVVFELQAGLQLRSQEVGLVQKQDEGGVRQKLALADCAP